MSSAGADGGSFESVEPKPEEARRLLHKALLSDRRAAEENIDVVFHHRHVEMYADWLHESGDATGAAKVRGVLTEGLQRTYQAETRYAGRRHSTTS